MQRCEKYQTAGDERKGGNVILEKQAATEVGRVLVVDDERVVREVGKRILERAGFSVRTAENGPGALDAIFNFDVGFDLIVLDLCMPGMTGLEVLREVRSRSEDVAVILVTGLDAEEHFKEVALDPRSDFIQKPYRMDDLLTKVHTMMHPSVV